MSNSTRSGARSSYCVHLCTLCLDRGFWKWEPLSVMLSFFMVGTMFKLHAMFRSGSFTTVHDMLMATFLELLWCITCYVSGSSKPTVYGMLIANMYLNAPILPQHLSIVFTTPQLNHCSQHCLLLTGWTARSTNYQTRIPSPMQTLFQKRYSGTN